MFIRKLWAPSFVIFIGTERHLFVSHNAAGFLWTSNLYALVIAFPEGGDPVLMWGNTGTLWGLCNKFLLLWWGKCGDFDFWMSYSRKECGDFASVQLRGDKERLIVRSINGKMGEEKKKASFKIHCFLSFKQTIKKTVKNLYVFVGISDFKIARIERKSSSFHGVVRKCQSSCLYCWQWLDFHKCAQYRW